MSRAIRSACWMPMLPSIKRNVLTRLKQNKHHRFQTLGDEKWKPDAKNQNTNLCKHILNVKKHSGVQKSNVSRVRFKDFTGEATSSRNLQRFYSTSCTVQTSRKKKWLNASNHGVHRHVLLLEQKQRCASFTVTCCIKSKRGKICCSDEVRTINRVSARATQFSLEPFKT